MLPTLVEHLDGLGREARSTVDKQYVSFHGITLNSMPINQTRRIAAPDMLHSPTGVTSTTFPPSQTSRSVMEINSWTSPR